MRILNRKKMIRKIPRKLNFSRTATARPTGRIPAKEKAKKAPNVDPGLFSWIDEELVAVRPAAGHILTAGGMAVTAVRLDDFITDVHRMHEILHLSPRRNVFLLLADDRVAQVAIFGYHLARRALVLAVMTAEAAGGVKMADMIRVRVP